MGEGPEGFAWAGPVRCEGFRASWMRRRGCGSCVPPSRRCLRLRPTCGNGSEDVGVTDIGAPILAADGSAIASIVIPYLNRHGQLSRYQLARERLITCCDTIARALRRPPQPTRPVNA